MSTVLGQGVVRRLTGRNTRAMQLEEWLRARNGIAPRAEARVEGFSERTLRTVNAIGRRWIALPDADVLLVRAAEHHARLACVSAAAHLGLALRTPPAELHLAVRHSARIHRHPELRFHTSRTIAPSTGGLIESVPDMLAHLARCLPARDAFAAWESAVRIGKAGLGELRRIPWPHLVARELSRVVTDKSDSILESMLAWELRRLGLSFRQQVRLLGQPVDFLVEERLVVQLDGYAFHGSPQQRRRDIEHDARLLVEGIPVVRRDYDQVVRGMPATLDLICRVLAGLARPDVPLPATAR